MAALRLAALLAASLALFAPIASAASAGGELESGAIALPAGATLESAGVDLLFESEAASLDLSATQITVQRIAESSAGDQGPLVGSVVEPANTEASHASGRITVVPGPDTRIAIRSLGHATGTIDASAVRGVEGALLAGLNEADATACRAEDYTCMDVFGVYEISSATVALDVSGDLVMIIYGATLVVEDAQGRTEYTSGRVSSSNTGPVEQTEDATVFVRATSATGKLAGDGRAFSAAPTIRAASITFEDASGSVRVGALDHRANGEDVAAAGDLLLVPGPVVRASGRDADPIYASTITTRVSGNIESIDLAGRLAFLDTPAQKLTAAAVLVAILSGAAYAWQHISFGAAALYTRLNKPDILENDVRNHIYDIIVQNPGISAREVHRRSNQSWGTVVYHLRQLERHHLVVSRALGRTRNYYENHGKYKGMEAQLACLQSDRARILARAIVAKPGITQEQLAIDAALPQPTTSYYVRKLKQAGLVEEQRDGRYVKYVPVADLPRFIQLSESSVQAGSAAGAGVQA